MAQNIVSDICGNCNNKVIYAEYIEKGEIVKITMQIPLSDIEESQKEKYQKMVLSGNDICECDDPFPDDSEFSM